MKKTRVRNRKQSALYASTFFQVINPYSLRSAKVIVPLVFDYLGQIDSCIDLGCGEGVWLSVFKDNGTKKCVGVDGAYVDASRLVIKPEEFVIWDLIAPYQSNEEFDLAVSLECAEHLPEDSAKDFVASLCRLSNAVLFSAAIPGQGGENHVNEQYPSYWAELFEHHGYSCIDTIRKTVWDNDEVAFYFRQNIFLYLKNGTTHDKRISEHRDNKTLLNVVHPKQLSHVIEHYARVTNLNDEMSITEWLATQINLLKLAPKVISKSIEYRTKKD